MSAAKQGPETIVVGIDGTDTSFLALRRAVKIAVAFDDKIEVAFVRQLPPVMGDEPGDVVQVYEDTVDEAERDSKDEVEKILADTGITWRMEVRDGDPAEELIDTAHETNAALVVVGAKMHGAVSSVVLSSVAGYLMHHCDVSILIVRPEPESGKPS